MHRDVHLKVPRFPHSWFLSHLSHPFDVITECAWVVMTNCTNATHSPTNAVLDSNKPCHSEKMSAEFSEVERCVWFADCVQYRSVKNSSPCLFTYVYLTHAVTRGRHNIGKHYGEFCLELCTYLDKRVNEKLNMVSWWPDISFRLPTLPPFWHFRNQDY